MNNCKVCGWRIFWQSCPTGGWWYHEHHPLDSHDAVSPNGDPQEEPLDV